MTTIPQAAIDAARDALAAENLDGLTTRIIARLALEAAEEVWPHESPQGSP